MVESSIVKAIRLYLSALPGYGIHAGKAVLFGSFARGETRQWSDIDLLVIAPEFDAHYTMEIVKKLWIATKHGDDRIEPIPCGEREWESESERAIVEIARREGVIIAL